MLRFDSPLSQETAMSTVAENPTSECPQTVLGAARRPLHPSGPWSRKRGRGCAPRPSKSALLPEIARLALAGHSGREIGKRLRVPRRTVARWLQELRQQWAANAAEDAAQLVPVTLAQLELAYREAMEAWRRSLADKEVTTETPGDDGRATPRTAVRKATQAGQATMLGKVIHAAKEIYTFQDALFFPRVPDGGIARMEITISTIMTKNERKC